ncbi:MAG: RsmB/NOP family class I SAM-dependent RNA methyltransferase [Clostridia bacterium]|nr:RsmB/NOP family class I SAM-dependent RNA methyltransferase [Clostridia bacterium]
MEENNIPDFLIKKLESQYGIEISNSILEGYNMQRYTTFRVNTIKSNNTEIEKALNDNNIKFEKVNFLKQAYVLPNCEESLIEELDIYKEGKIYLQSLSSMLPPIILNPEEKIDILDMCAAPGGKTTELAALTNNKAHITACEMNKIRLDRLKYNLNKQGASSVYLMNIDARNIDNFFAFDKILLDAPCSGSGTLNSKDEKVSKYFTDTLIQKSVKTQTALINKAINVLKKDGELIYSTCSILQCENEDIVNNVLKTGKVELVPISNELLEDLPLLPTNIPGTLCIKPNQYFEGFFVAKLRKI